VCALLPRVSVRKRTYAALVRLDLCEGGRARPRPPRLCAFLDPPKDSATGAIAALHKHGLAVKILTGDDHLVSRKVCRANGVQRPDNRRGAGLSRSAYCRHRACQEPRGIRRQPD
jgi:hypothetical protein